MVPPEGAPFVRPLAAAKQSFAAARCTKRRSLFVLRSTSAALQHLCDVAQVEGRKVLPPVLLSTLLCSFAAQKRARSQRMVPL